MYNAVFMDLMDSPSLRRYDFANYSEDFAGPLAPRSELCWISWDATWTKVGPIHGLSAPRLGIGYILGAAWIQKDATCPVMLIFHQASTEQKACS